MKLKKIKINYKDNRGTITDIFYKEKIDHIAIIRSKKGALRGNHYHKRTTQYMLITKGKLEYWYKNKNSKNRPKVKVLKIGDLVETPPNEMHALKIIENNEFIVFTKGIRGGKDYESDTYRFEPSIIGKR